MRTVKFSHVLHGVASLMGLDPERNLTPPLALALTRHINKWTRKGWEAMPWPELSVIEERFYRADYDAAATYAAADEVYDPATDSYYRSLQASNLAHALTDTTWWEPATGLRKYLPLEAPGFTKIGEVLEITAADPRVSAAHCPPIPFHLLGPDIQFWPGAPNHVWLKFRLQPSVFTTRLWSSTELNVEGDLRYVAEDGDCYLALESTSGDFPPLADEWQLVPMPHLLAEYVKQGAYADALKEDGQADKARAELADAAELLDDAMSKIVITQDQRASFAVRR